MALVQPASRALARLDWRAEMLSHLQDPALALTLLAIGLAARPRPRWAIALGALALFQAIPFVQYLGANPVRPDPASSDRLRLLVVNIYEQNHRYDELIRLIRREQPDVFGMVEVTPGWVTHLAELHRDYPYRAEYAYGSNGLTLWFRRRPLAIDPPRRLRKDAWPFLHATFAFAGRLHHVWLVHPLSPLNRRDDDPRNDELAALAAHVGAVGGSRIMVGDMNCTDSSPYFADFLRVARLRDSRYGFGREGSWPSWLPAPLRIAIDHALVSGDLAVTERRLGPKVGSDHMPVVLELAPALANAETQASHSSP